MHRRMDISEMIARLASVRDAELAGSQHTHEAELLVARITSEVVPVTARRRRASTRRPALLSLAGAGAALAIAAAIFATSSTVDTKPAAAGVPFRSTGGYIVASVRDPFAAAADLTAAFRARGLDISLHLLPVSPSLVGTVVAMSVSSSSDEGDIQALQDGGCVTGGGACPIGLRIARRFSGTAEISLGRPARPHETYASATSALAPGEELHCTALLGAAVADALPILRARGVRVTWRTETLGSSNAPVAASPNQAPRADDYIWAIDAMAPREVMVWTNPTRLTQESAAGNIPDLAAYEARLNRGC
jgi:hypothetical protein